MTTITLTDATTTNNNNSIGSSIIDVNLITNTITNAASNNTNTTMTLPLLSRTPQAISIAISDSKHPETPIGNSNANTTAKSDYSPGGSNSKFSVPLPFSLASHIVYLYSTLPAWLLPSKQS